MKHSAEIRTFLLQVVGTTVVYIVLAIFFVAHMQGLVDSGLMEIPWMYYIPAFMAFYPFYVPLNSCSEHLRPLFVPFEGIFGSADNAAIFTIILLQAIFWSLTIVGSRRLIIVLFQKLKHKHNKA